MDDANYEREIEERIDEAVRDLEAQIKELEALITQINARLEECTSQLANVRVEI